MKMGTFTKGSLTIDYRVQPFIQVSHTVSSQPLTSPNNNMSSADPNKLMATADSSSSTMNIELHHTLRMTEGPPTS